MAMIKPNDGTHIASLMMPRNDVSSGINVLFTAKTIHELPPDEQPAPDGASLAYLALVAKLNRKQSSERKRREAVQEELLARVEDALNAILAESLVVEDQLLTLAKSP